MKKYLSYLVLLYLRLAARLQLNKNQSATIIGVTGSSGKTSAILAIVKILGTKGVVKHTSGTNSQSGIPLNILGLAPTNYSVLDWLRLLILTPYQLLTNWEHYNYYVIEMGIDGPSYPKNMDYLLSIVRPHIALVLNAGLSHTASFDHLVKDTSPTRRIPKLIALVAHEKMKLAHSIAQRGTVIINIDQKELRTELKGVRARQLTIGVSKSAQLQILSPHLTKQGSRFSYRYQGSKYTLAVSDIFSATYAHAFAGALAVGAVLGVSPDKGITALLGYRAPAGRLRILQGIKGSTIIDSSYNASPLAMTEALKLLAQLGVKQHKLAVLGDMRELGSSTKLVHKELAGMVSHSCDEVILFGTLTAAYTLPLLLEQKFPVRHFTHMSELIKHLRARITPNSLILIKGSQNTILLERAVEAILADKSDRDKLCRRGPYWDELRLATP